MNHKLRYSYGMYRPSEAWLDCTPGAIYSHIRFKLEPCAENNILGSSVEEKYPGIISKLD